MKELTWDYMTVRWTNSQWIWAVLSLRTSLSATLEMAVRRRNENGTDAAARHSKRSHVKSIEGNNHTDLRGTDKKNKVDKVQDTGFGQKRSIDTSPEKGFYELTCVIRIHSKQQATINDLMKNVFFAACE